MNDIFDLSSIDDLPPEIRNDLNIDIFACRIIELFKLAQRELTIDEITVGYYRKFIEFEEEKKTKRQITLKLYNMSKEKNAKIKSVIGKKGLYTLSETQENDTKTSSISEGYDEIPF